VIESAGWEVTKLAEFPGTDLVLKTACFAAFFKLIEETQRLEEIYRKAQGEIAGVCGNESWPRDLGLVLLVPGDKPPEPSVVRGIVDDRYVCRKFVLWLNGRELNELLADLPFWRPGDLLGGAPILVGAGVQELMKGYDPNLVADLASYSPGAERVFEKIRDGQYEVAPSGPAGEAMPRSRISEPTLARLQGIEITDFRGIRRLRIEEMPLSGDVVFVYGPNGVGKTSIADALEWAVTGQVDRLAQGPPRSVRGGPDPIINVFSEDGEARVVCQLSSGEPVSRFRHGLRTERLVGSRTTADDHVVIDHVVGTKAPSREARLPIRRLRALFRGSHMLSQHDIRQFLQQSTPAERFDILTNMIGAEEFVRFREKTTSVLQHLHSHSRTAEEVAQSLRRELEGLSGKLTERRSEFAKLQEAVAPDESPEHVATELLAGLRKCRCAVDEALVQRTGGEPAERRFEIIAVHADAVIRNKRTELDSLLMRLKGLEQGLRGYTESRTHCGKLVAEIASTKNTAQKTDSDLRKQEEALHGLRAGLGIIKARQSEAARRYTDLAWLGENLPSYARAKSTLQQVEDALAGQRKELRRLEDALEEKQRALESKRGLLKEVEQAIDVKTKRGQALTSLVERLPAVLTRRHEAEQLNKKASALGLQAGALKGDLGRAQDEVNTARVQMAEAQRAYDAEAVHHDLLSSFLARIAELVCLPECPLCGRSFASAAAARASIQEHLSRLAPELRNMARRLDEAKKNVDAKQTRVSSTAERLRALEIERQQVGSDELAATQVMQTFLAECAALSVQVSADGPVAMQAALGQALKECETTALRSEVHGLREAINALVAGVQQQQRIVDSLRGMLAKHEKDRTQQASVIQGFEADMVQRGFEPTSLPEGDRLARQLEDALGVARESSELVAKRETEIRTAESAVKALRECVNRANEAVASETAQLQQYETACSRFVSECQATGVDADNPKESIGAVRQGAEEQKNLLTSLEKARQVLQLFIGLDRLRLEIESLSRTESDLERRVEASAKEDARLKEWLSCMEKLEGDVVKQQVSAVGAHLELLEPTTQRLYQRLNPHPIFGTVKIKVDDRTHELDVEAMAPTAAEWLRDVAISPPEFFSDAQMNALAITVFLAGALRQRWSGFRTILIDDPVQQMDEMNVCAFLDLIRGLSSERQFIIFTCSRDFYLLALDKMDCLNKSKPGSFLAYRLEGTAPAELKVHCDAR
jgi:DNA repair exonuclease SbcCD ATPase subunit